MRGDLRARFPAEPDHHPKQTSGNPPIEHAKDAPNDAWIKFAVMGIIIISACAVLAAWCGACWPGNMPNFVFLCQSLRGLLEIFLALPDLLMQFRSL